ncbi:MAG: molybdopterin cofactor-binding domain-containing protein [Parvularculales bacterium]
MAKWTRRAVIGSGLLAGGAFVVGVALRPGNPVDELKPLVAGGQGENLINSWVKIDADNVVTAIIPHTEMGQGVRTSLVQMLADEMDADWDKIAVMEAPTTGDYVSQHMVRLFFAPGTLDAPPWLDPTLDGILTQVSKLAGGYATGGSSSVRATGQRGMRVAGAAAREMLIAAAAEAWNVPAGDIRTANSTLLHDGSGRSAAYAVFADAASRQSLPTHPKLKTPDQFKLMGKSMPRVDLDEKVNGSAQYGIDATIPGQTMRYGAIFAAPVPDSTIKSVNDTQAKTMPGVLEVINFGGFVAVIAEGYWQAQQALDTVEMDFSKTPNDNLDQKGLFDRYEKALSEAGDEGGDVLGEAGDVISASDNAPATVEAEYRVPFLAHGAMEPVNCTGWVHDGVCDLWTSAQVPLRAISEVSDATGIAADNINLHQMEMGGSFGRRLRDDYAVISARVAQAVNYPVKVIWSREEDIQKAYYRTCTTSRFKAGLESAGRPVSWDNVYVHQEAPPEAAFVDYYDIPNKRIRTLPDVPMHLRFGDWRSVDESQHGFFKESFMDELAHKAGVDPFEYRLALLNKSPRHKAVLEGVAEMSGWGRKLPAGHGRGIALVPSFGTIVAQVADVELSGGTPRVVRVYCCADPGFAVNPSGFEAQMESAIVYGLTAVLYGEISLEEGAVVQSNFHDYEILRMEEMPDIEVKIINGDNVVLGGGGEPGLPPIAPAVANAVFAATGVRVRELPLNNITFA